MREPDKMEAKDLENANQDILPEYNGTQQEEKKGGSASRRSVVLVLAGGYLIYLGYQLCKGMLEGQEGSAWYFWAAGILFVVVGAAILLYGGKNMLKIDKERRAEAAKIAEQEKKAASAGDKKKSISDKANLVKNLGQGNDEASYLSPAAGGSVENRPTESLDQQDPQ